MTIPAGRPDEIYDIGIGVARGLVALPGAAARLHAHDPDGLALLAGAARRASACSSTPATGSSFSSGRPAELVLSGSSLPTDACCGGRRPPDREPGPSQRQRRAHPAAQRRRLPEAIDQLLREHAIPLVEGSTCTFLWRGEADWVGVEHRVMGVPIPLPLRRIRRAPTSGTRASSCHGARNFERVYASSSVE